MYKHVSTTPGRITSAEQIQKHTKEKENYIHEKNALKKIPELRIYTKNSHTINGALHENKFNDDDDDVKRIIKEIDLILNSASLHEDTHVYTGLKRTPARYFTGSGTAKVHLTAYTSTSTGYDKASMFTRPEKKITQYSAKHSPLNSDAEFKRTKYGTLHMLKIQLPKGTKAGSVKKISVYSSENEILLHRGYNIEIYPHPTINHDGIHVWHARVISHTPGKI